MGGWFALCIVGSGPEKAPLLCRAEQHSGVQNKVWSQFAHAIGFIPGLHARPYLRKTKFRDFMRSGPPDDTAQGKMSPSRKPQGDYIGKETRIETAVMKVASLCFVPLVTGPVT